MVNSWEGKLFSGKCLILQVFFFLSVYLQQTDTAADAAIPLVGSKARPQNKLLSSASPFWAIIIVVPPVI